MEVTGPLGSHSLVPVLAEVAALGLLQWRSLAQDCSGRCPWLEPTPAEVPGLDPLPQRSLAWTFSLSSCSPLLKTVFYIN